MAPGGGGGGGSSRAEEGNAKAWSVSVFRMRLRAGQIAS
jgi:hypothetical protein